MKVPTMEEIKKALLIPEVQSTRNKSWVRGDLVTPAQKLVKDKIKININREVQEQLKNKTMRKKTKWDI
tara:strand:- start:304 stop:510 length:207 start_codon:yes stop_codon:yes gene_type:complete